MTKSRILTGALSALVVCTPLAARAEQKLRVQVDQRGDFTLIGNTLGWDCGAGAAAPVKGEVSGGIGGFLPCGLGNGFVRDDTSPDLFWRSDAPSDGQAQADSMLTVGDARSSAVLELPAGAVVSHAYLYWGARRVGAAADTSVVFERPGGFMSTVDATSSTVVNMPLNTIGRANIVYQSVADVTTLVAAAGNGPYRLSGVDTINFVNTAEDVLFAGWALVVVYKLDTEAPRNLAVFDGLDAVAQGTSSSVSLSGFLVPNAGFDAKLGTIVYEGDNAFQGDSLSFGTAPLGAMDVLSDAENPAQNFFNGSHSALGLPVSTAGDLPQLAGTAGTMAGIDLDVVDITSRVKPGQSSADVTASTNLDVFFLGAFVTSISTFRPDFVTSEKTVRDVNGGGIAVGDVLEYTIVAKNTGNDASSNTVVTDPLPQGITYVPGSIKVLDGANAGAKTDATGDDEASYDGATRTLSINIGVGASATAGGTVEVGGSNSITFRATVDANAPAKISNQATIDAAGVRGAPTVSTLTDGNADGPGVPPTDVDNGGGQDCKSNADCPASRPFCDVKSGRCVECTDDSQCAGPLLTCDLASSSCVCNGTPAECKDTDDDGVPDGGEITDGTDPKDSDSDDDGVPDGREPDRTKDSDGDGLINALDPDSDNDGLYDGTEIGLDCSNPGTDLTKHHCRADADRGATVTDPLDRDTDDGGASDGSEDNNLDGKKDPGERDPTLGHGSDDKSGTDKDGDGLSDDTEDHIGTDPNDSDTDDDGVRDGDEANPADDTDGDGAINARDPDSDNDGLLDGTETGTDCSDKGTVRVNCVPDADAGATTTSPVDRDTDHGGASDGSEDSNLDGKQDPGERDPTKGHGADDQSVTDSDGDGLGDDTEKTLGSDPMDADTDDDGVPDGQEANPSVDTDGDGTKNVLDPDSDNDGLFDGTESGRGCSDPATDTSKGTCVADADNGKTKTSPVQADTDRGGVNDGEEDTNRNGAIDPGERDPNNRCDDGVFTCDVSPVGPGTSGYGSLAGASACSVQPGVGGSSFLGAALSSLLLALVARRRKHGKRAA